MSATMTEPSSLSLVDHFEPGAGIARKQEEEEEQTTTLSDAKDDVDDDHTETSTSTTTFKNELSRLLMTDPTDTVSVISVRQLVDELHDTLHVHSWFEFELLAPRNLPKQPVVLATKLLRIHQYVRLGNDLSAVTSIHDIIKDLAAHDKSLLDIGVSTRSLVTINDDEEEKQEVTSADSFLDSSSRRFLTLMNNSSRSQYRDDPGERSSTVVVPQESFEDDIHDESVLARLESQQHQHTTNLSKFLNPFEIGSPGDESLRTTISHRTSSILRRQPKKRVYVMMILLPTILITLIAMVLFIPPKVSTSKQTQNAIAMLEPHIPNVPSGDKQEEALEWLVDYDYDQQLIVPSSDNDGTETIVSTTTGQLLDRYVMAMLFLSLQGDHWTTNDGWMSPHSACRWWSPGTICGNQDKDSTNGDKEGIRIDRIWLYENNLQGSIPTELGTMTHLTYLNLGANTVSATLPTEIGLLTKLTHLLLPKNDLTGTMPTELARLTSVTSLWLSNNQLTGKIPTELGGFLASLSWCFLGCNDQLEGIPPNCRGCGDKKYGFHEDQ